MPDAPLHPAQGRRVNRQQQLKTEEQYTNETPSSIHPRHAVHSLHSYGTEHRYMGGHRRPGPQDAHIRRGAPQDRCQAAHRGHLLHHLAYTRPAQREALPRRRDTRAAARPRCTHEQRQPCMDRRLLPLGRTRIRILPLPGPLCHPPRPDDAGRCRRRCAHPRRDECRALLG